MAISTPGLFSRKQLTWIAFYRFRVILSGSRDDPAMLGSLGSGLLKSVDVSFVAGKGK